MAEVVVSLSRQCGSSAFKAREYQVYLGLAYHFAVINKQLPLLAGNWRRKAWRQDVMVVPLSCPDDMTPAGKRNPSFPHLIPRLQLWGPVEAIIPWHSENNMGSGLSLLAGTCRRHGTTV